MYSSKYYVKPKVMQLLMYVQYKHVQLTMCLTHVFSRMCNVKMKRPVCCTYMYVFKHLFCICFTFSFHVFNTCDQLKAFANIKDDACIFMSHMCITYKFHALFQMSRLTLLIYMYTCMYY